MKKHFNLKSDGEVKLLTLFLVTSFWGLGMLELRLFNSYFTALDNLSSINRRVSDILDRPLIITLKRNGTKYR